MVWMLTLSIVQGQYVGGKVGRALRELGCLIRLIIFSYLGLRLAIIKRKAIIPKAWHCVTRQNFWGWAMY